MWGSSFIQNKFWASFLKYKGSEVSSFCAGLISTVKISGSPDKCQIAKTLINLALGHHLASIKDLEADTEGFSIDHTSGDIRTIFHEIYKNKCW